MREDLWAKFRQNIVDFGPESSASMDESIGIEQMRAWVLTEFDQTLKDVEADRQEHMRISKAEFEAAEPKFRGNPS